MITKVIAIAAIKADAYCTSTFVDGVEVVTYESGVTPIDESLVDAKVAELQAIQAYQSKRTVGTATTSGYNTITEQLDQLYRDINSGKFGSDAKTGEWFVGISSVKTGFPKP